MSALEDSQTEAAGLFSAPIQTLDVSTRTVWDWRDQAVAPVRQSSLSPGFGVDTRRQLSPLTQHPMRTSPLRDCTKPDRSARVVAPASLGCEDERDPSPPKAISVCA